MRKLRPVVLTLLAAAIIGTAAWYLISLAGALAGSLVNAGLIR
jgi:hypothetical protein